MSHKFIGGVHPPDKKAPANAKMAERLAAPPQVVLPVSLHIGAPCQPVVAVGDTVKLGQKIADSPAPVSAPIHASVSGKVVAIEPRLHSNGAMVNSIVIENDGLDTPAETMVPCPAEAAGDPDAIVAAIREAGIVGMGGATFPTAFKITSGKGQVNTLIINGAECEPYISSDYRAMLERPDEVLGGIRLLMTACGVEKAHFGIEKNKQDAIDLLKGRLTAGDGIEILELVCRYPQGAEKQLVHTVTGREVPRGGLPMDTGCVVENVSTAFAVYDAVINGRPLVRRVVTVTGDAVEKPSNLLVPCGTPYADLVAACGGVKGKAAKVISGGPMMGFTVGSLTVPTGKTTSGLLLLPPGKVTCFTSQACIACGRCVDACPMRLSPAELSQCVEADDIEGAEQVALMDCIECGSCAFVCPARRPLVHHFRRGKAAVMARRAAAKKNAQR